mmetsp:Transcript_6295/g.23740  ORF Transcript_6295/g.23740 Transcript_6295/m.23740 type:complete len:206 (-) Transcript_6295:1027-1644(-)
MPLSKFSTLNSGAGASRAPDSLRVPLYPSPPPSLPPHSLSNLPSTSSSSIAYHALASFSLNASTNECVAPPMKSTVKITIIRVAVLRVVPTSLPKSLTDADANANATAPRNPETNNAFWWFTGMGFFRPRHRFTALVIGKIFNPRPTTHPTSATHANGTVLEKSPDSRNKPTPMYRNTNVSASVARVLKITPASLRVADVKLGFT